MFREDCIYLHQINNIYSIKSIFMRSWLKEYWGCIIEIIIVLSLFVGCRWYNSYSKEKGFRKLYEEKRSKVLRKAIIRDSLNHDPRYQDSLRREKAAFEEYERLLAFYQEKEFIGIVYGNDTVYHTCFHTIHDIENNSIYLNFIDEDIDSLWLLTNKKAKELGIKECEKCEEINTIYSEYEEGDLIYSY